MSNLPSGLSRSDLQYIYGAKPTAETDCCGRLTDDYMMCFRCGKTLCEEHSTEHQWLLGLCGDHVDAELQNIYFKVQNLTALIEQTTSARVEWDGARPRLEYGWHSQKQNHDKRS